MIPVRALALAVAWLLALASVAPHDPAASAILPGETRVLALDRATGKPASGADVVWAEGKVLVDGEAALGRRLTAGERDALVAGHGQRALTDERGQAVIALQKSAWVQVRQGSSFGETFLESTATDPVSIDLEPNIEWTVHVVDADGRGVAGVPVRMDADRPHMEGGPEIPPFTMAWEMSGGDDGAVRFPHVQRIVSGNGPVRLEVGIPLAKSLGETIEVRARSEPVRFVLPPTGSVVVRASGITGARVRLSADKGARFRGPSWDDGSEVALVGGEARFAHVGLGLKLVAEITGPSLAEPIRRPIEGPKDAGQLVNADVAVKQDVVLLRGRTLDEDLAPLAIFKLSLDVSTSCQTEHGGSSGSKGSWATTDAEGRFTLQIARKVDAGCTRSILVRPDWREVKDFAHEREPSASADLPDEVTASELDLGDLRLSAPSSPRRFANLSDDELERAAHAAVTKPEGRGGQYIEGLMIEIARRGGSRLEAFLVGEIEELRKPVEPPEFRRGSFELPVLTALRRIQRAPDPLALRVAPDSRAAVEFPQSPVFHMQIVNADAKGATLHVADGGGYRSGRLERWRVDVRTLDGKPIEPIAWGGGMMGGMQSSRDLAPGEALEVEIRLANYVVVTEPGAYEARIQYHDQESISMMSDVGNLMVMSSPWTRFEIQPRKVALTKADDARARKVVADAVVPETIVTYWTVYDPATPSTGEARTSEEVLFALGWKSLPALLAALDEKALTVRKRAWVLAQLYNLTGLNDPSAQAGIVGKHEHTPGPLETGSMAGRAFVTGWSADGPIDEAKQRAFADRWKQSAKGFRFEIVD